MIARTIEGAQRRFGEHHLTFFRQSGWLVVSAIVGGFLTLGVHLLSKLVSEAQYSAFGVMLVVTMCLPTLPLQMVFAQQTASALATGRERQLASMIRLTWLSITAVWLVGAILLAIYQGPLAREWKIAHPVALWVTWVSDLFALWSPLFLGILQGRQNFFWMGWIAILSGVFRLVVAGLLVLVLSGGATGMMIGVLVGTGGSVVIFLWQTRDLWTLPGARFNRRSLLRQVMPLVFGFGAWQFMFTYDTMIAKAFFSPDAMAPYTAAGTLSRALLWLVLPLATVMFPKIVHSTVRAEKISLLGIVLGGATVLAGCGGLGLCLLGPWVVRLVFTSQYVNHTIALLPWYVGAIIPLALSNVVLNDLLARSRFRVVPFIVALTLAYAVALPYILSHFPSRLETVLQTLGVFNLLILGVSLWAAFGHTGPKTVTAEPLGPGRAS